MNNSTDQQPLPDSNHCMETKSLQPDLINTNNKGTERRGGSKHFNKDHCRGSTVYFNHVLLVYPEEEIDSRKR